jgi:hypothetical protein
MPWIFKQKDIQPPELHTGGPIADKTPNSRAWKIIQAAADKNTEAMTDMVIRAADKTRSEADIKQMLQGIYNNDSVKIENAVPWDAFKAELTAAEPLMEDTLNRSGQEMIVTLPMEQRDVVFDTGSPRSLSWIKARTAELVTEVSNETVLALREAVRSAAEAGYGADKTAEHLKSLIGLTTRQAGAVTNYRDRLISSGKKYERAQTMADKYSKRLLQYRAENIARTELMRASNQGFNEMLQQGADQGILPPSTYEIYWILTPDDRLCDKCKEMAGVTTTLGQPFSTAAGNIDTPPLHPSCRCTLGVRFKE